MCDDMHVKALKIAVKLPMYNGGNAMNTILGRAGIAGISMDPHPNAANANVLGTDVASEAWVPDTANTALHCCIPVE